MIEDFNGFHSLPAKRRDRPVSRHLLQALIELHMRVIELGLPAHLEPKSLIVDEVLDDS